MGTIKRDVVSAKDVSKKPAKELIDFNLLYLNIEQENLEEIQEYEVNPISWTGWEGTTLLGTYLH